MSYGRVVLCRHGRELSQDVFCSKRRRGNLFECLFEDEEQRARKKPTSIEPGADGVLFMLAELGTRVTATRSSRRYVRNSRQPLLALGCQSLQDGGPAQDREHGCREIVMGMV